MIFYLDSKETRKMRLINLLYSSQGYTVSELSKALSISPKTARIELGELASYLAQWEPNIKVVKVDSIWKIKKSVTFNLDYVYSDIKQNSFQFILIFSILSKSSKNYSNFLKTNYYSNGTGYKKIKDINNFLKVYGISIDTKTFRLVGEELTIRLFLYKMLKEVKFVHMTGRNSVIIEELSSNLERLKVILGAAFIEKEYENLAIVLFILRQRDCKKYKQLLKKNAQEIELVHTNTLFEYKGEYASIMAIYTLLSQKNGGFQAIEKNVGEDVKRFNSELKHFFQLSYISKGMKDNLGFIFLCYATVNSTLASLLVDIGNYHKSSSFLSCFDSFYKQFVSHKLNKKIYNDCFYLKQSLGMYLDKNLPTNKFHPKINIAILVQKNQVIIEKLRTELSLLGFNLVFFEEDKDIVDIVITNYYDKKENVIYLNQYPTDQEMIEISQILCEFEAAKNKILV
ncbi:helix-turn-helix domain-containing protein [Carnobacterium maltaromaticum]|uniref:Helix-turn-helix domain-containing protein n=1 Tax=Carnobacterium maltaromaticum TaxID=2751 RepID=A0AAW9JWF3_CARML|nr:helix-turn-helix domain-containing protein [Carnobacterium maltaromaticum]MDZ5759624.1 helix-turn-helix domain-containing protein [Carnobacterium maltaromaticum]